MGYITRLNLIVMFVQGADGTYGTSLAYGTAMDPSCDVMVAYKQNERFLAPDHGFPIRMIIPGHIGELASLMRQWRSESALLMCSASSCMLTLVGSLGSS